MLAVTGDQFIVAAVAAFFALMGLAALVQPAAIVALFGGTAETPDSRNEIRAVYGGFGIALAALLFATLSSTSAWRGGALLAVAVSLIGMAGGRLIAFVVERPQGFFPTVTFLIVELVLAGALLSAR